uniref:Uncharacterized protein n=1 Tax=Lepeophtheirus salmonis TaxID=72036 RepID=A0A0K2U3E0_LEPSM
MFVSFTISINAIYSVFAKLVCFFLQFTSRILIWKFFQINRKWTSHLYNFLDANMLVCYLKFITHCFFYFHNDNAKVTRGNNKSNIFFGGRAKLKVTQHDNLYYINIVL